VHSDAATAADTDWGQIVQLYDQLLAVRADLLARLGDAAEAARAYDRAIALANNTAERTLLEKKRAALPR
jgi:RNA polymerase sigma-70 factor (ECF subfamily)